MSVLFRIVYAAHANGTHHKLALDALNHMQRPHAESWRRVILKNVEKYLEGSKAPDNTFKDFKNHVLHVGENYWGGAPEKVEEWYAATVAALRAERWNEAAYAAGVLSHYYTDPVMPFHTAQTEAENAIHRATEWSINRSYNALRRIGEQRFTSLSVKSHDGPNWLKEMTCDGAEFSHRYYEKLIAHYDIHKGSVRPEDGLDNIAQTIVAELLMYAASGFGTVLDRAFAESGVAAPDVGLTLETFLATLKMPAKWIEKKLTNAEDRRLVQAMYDELKATGRVENTLTEDDRTIRDLHAAEVLAPKRAAQKANRKARLPAQTTTDQTATGMSALEAALANSAKAIAKTLPAATTIPAQRPAPILAPEIPDSPPVAIVVEEEPLALPPKGTFNKPRYEPEIEPERTAASHVGAVRRSYLQASSMLEDAPSIGPKMAGRFAGLGIHTVADFIGHDPHDMAELLDDSHIDSEVLTDWQDQAQLVMDIPGLRGTHAQLLVGAGYRTAGAIADAGAIDLSADVLKFAATSDGKRVLRDGHPPDIEKIKDWVDSARIALAA